MITGELAEICRTGVPLAANEQTFRTGFDIIANELQARWQHNSDIITNFVRNGDSEWTLRHWLKYDEPRTEADSLLEHPDGSVAFVSLAMRGVHASLDEIRATATYCSITEFPEEMVSTMKRRAAAEPQRTLLGILSKAANPKYPDDMPDSFNFPGRLDDDDVSEELLSRWNKHVNQVTARLDECAPRLDVDDWITSARNQAADTVAEAETHFYAIRELLIKGQVDDPSRIPVAELMLDGLSLKQLYDVYFHRLVELRGSLNWEPVVVESLVEGGIHWEHSLLHRYLEGLAVRSNTAQVMKALYPTVGAIALGPSPSQTNLN